MKPAFLRSLFWDVGASTLTLLLPLLIFLKHHDYPLTQPESSLLLALVIPVGLVFGLLMSLGRIPGRLALTVFLAVLVVDIQTTWITTWGLRLLLNVLGFGILFWFLRRHLSQVVLIIAAAMVVGTLVTPGREQVWTGGEDLGQPATASAMPFILHLVLDGHQGIEGIPRQFDADGKIAAQVSNAYLDHGFRVFGRAYSSYYVTNKSLSNLLNFSTIKNPKPYGAPLEFDHWSLKENAWFQYLHDLGYWIHVIQPDFQGYDRFGGPDGELSARSSYTYTWISVSALASLEVPVLDKARILMGTYVNLSFFLGLVGEGYGILHRISKGIFPDLSDWYELESKLDTLSSIHSLGRLEEDLKFAAPGRAYFAHLLLPHEPYVYDRDCGIRPVASGWLGNADPAADPKRNDPASRALRYGQYLEQVICTTHRVGGILEMLSSRPWWDDAVVVIHSDHGSRINLVPPHLRHKEDLSAQDMMDSFSTLFAIKKPGLVAEYDRRQLSIQHLFRTLMFEGIDPGDADLESRPRVLIWDESNPMQEVDLPIFDHGLPLSNPLRGP